MKLLIRVVHARHAQPRTFVVAYDDGEDCDCCETKGGVEADDDDDDGCDGCDCYYYYLSYQQVNRNHDGTITGMTALDKGVTPRKHSEEATH